MNVCNLNCRKDFIEYYRQALEEAMREGKKEGATEMSLKIMNILANYPQNLHDEISFVLDEYLATLK